MSNFFLNHGCLIGESNAELNEKLGNLVKKVSLLKENNGTLSVIVDFWNIDIEEGILSDYIKNSLNVDRNFLIVMILMNSGPYFIMENNFESFDELSLNPEVEENSFGYNFIYSSILNDNMNVISFENPKHITESKYIYNIDTLEGTINNYIGLAEVKGFFKQELEFKNINDVFMKVQSEFKNIVFLDQAIKTASRHNFQGNLDKVFKAIRGLSEIEVKPLSNGENREERFYKETGLKISPETKSTLEMPRFKKEREFLIPSIGKKLFEWHVKIGNNTRIHYYVDEINKTIYVGHCAYHLGTVSFNS